MILRQAHLTPRVLLASAVTAVALLFTVASGFQLILGLLCLAAAGTTVALVQVDRRNTPQPSPDQGDQTALILDAISPGIVVLDGDGHTLHINRAASTMFGVDPSRAIGQPFGFGVVTFTDQHGRALPTEHQLTVLASVEEELVDTVVGIMRQDGGRVWTSISSRILATPAQPAQPHVVLTVTDITSRHEAAIASEAETVQLRHRALHDSLTGLPNRTLLMDRLAHAKQNSGRRGSGTGLVVIDLDGFKAVNDTLGHAAGDEVLVQVAVRLRTTLRASDTAARLGGDEFVVLCEDLHPGMADLELARVAERIQSLLDEPYITSAGPTEVGASVGWAVGRPGENLDLELVIEADEAMLAAKRRRKSEAQSEAHRAETPSVRPRPGKAGSVSVYVVDDDPAMRLLANRILETSGTRLHVIGEAADGASAIQQILKMSPDVVLCDVMMPRVSGPEVVDAVRAQRAEQQFIFWSATGAAELERYEQEMGVPYVLKDRIEELPAALLELWGDTPSPRRGR